MSLASTLLDRAERTLGFERSSIGIPGLESTNLLTVLNAAVKEYFSSFEKAGEPPTILKKEKGYTIVTDTALNGALSIGATSIVGDSFASFGSSGAIAIDGRDYVEFGANNLTTTLSSVTGVNVAHADNSSVSLLYALPSDFDSFRSEEGVEDAVTVDDIPYFFTSGTPSGRRFALYDNGTTKYLHFPVGSSGKVFVRYNGTPTVVDGESDTVDIPTKDEDFGMWKVVEYAAPLLERMDMMQIAQGKSMEILRSAHMRRNIGKRPKTRPMAIPSGISRSMLFDA